MSVIQLPNRLPRALRQIDIAVEKQKIVVAEFHEVIKELDAEIQEMDKTLRAYKVSLSRIDVVKVGKKARRLAKIMDRSKVQVA